MTTEATPVAMEEADSKVPGAWWFYAALALVAACIKAKEATDGR